MDVHDIAKAILDDETMTYDDLELLISTVSIKRKKIASRQRLRIGDTVRLRNIKPRYMEGQTGVIKGQKNTKIVVLLDAPTGRFSKEVHVHRTCIEVIARKTKEEE